MIDYFLTWYDKKGDNYMGEAFLPVSGDDVLRIFGLDPDDTPGGCFEVGEEHVGWLETVAKSVRIRLDCFDYFVQDSQGN